MTEINSTKRRYKLSPLIEIVYPEGSSEVVGRIFADGPVEWDREHYDIPEWLIEHWAAIAALAGP